MRFGSLLIVGLFLGSVQPSVAEETAGFATVPEMTTPPGILAQPRAERRAVRQRAAGLEALKRLESRVAELWPEIRQLDLVELSRFHVDATKSFALPDAPGELTGEILAHDAEADTWYVQVRGPRLPARFDIVHRYLYVMARYNPASQELDRITVTIRGWVLE